MRKFNKILIVIIPLLSVYFISCSCKCGDNEEISIPEKVLNSADQFIITKTGKEFFQNYISIDTEKSREISPNYFLVYDFKIPEKSYVDEEISFLIDKNGTLVKGQQITGIPGCLNSSESCEFNITEEEALNIAQKSGLEKGIKEWKSGFLWNVKHNKYVWHILSTESESEGEYTRGKGKEMIIDPNSGEVIETNNWYVR
jgi:hypothetical protein